MKKHEIAVDNLAAPQLSRKGRRGGKGRRAGRPRNKKTMTISTTVAVVVCLCLAAWGVNALLRAQILGGASGDPETNEAIDDFVQDKVTILLLGIDAEDVNTDTIMLAMLDCKTKKVNLLSIPRDTRVKNPWGGGGHAKINSVYIAKGMKGIINQVNELTGLPINFYMKISYEGFRKAIDALGGVEYDVPMRLEYHDPAQNLHIDLQAGKQLLNGSKAEQLVRARNQYPEADLTRTQVQRDFMKALIQQKATPAIITKIPALYSQLSPYVVTNITVGDALKYIAPLAQVREENIQMFMMPGSADGDFFADTKQMEQLANDIFWFDVDIKPTIKPIVGYSAPPATPKNSSAPAAATATPAPTGQPGEDADGENGKPPTPAATPTQAPRTTPRPTQKPTEGPAATPAATQAPAAHTPPPSHPPTGGPAPSAYPDGL